MARRLATAAVLAVATFASSAPARAADPVLPAGAYPAAQTQLPAGTYPQAPAAQTQAAPDPAATLGALQAAKADLRRIGRELKAAKAAVPGAVKAAAAANAAARALDRKSAAAAAAVTAARRRLDQAAAEYVSLVHGVDSAQAGVAGNEEQLMSYLSDSSAADAVLVYQMGSVLLDRQSGLLDATRTAAADVQRRSAQLQRISARQHKLVQDAADGVRAARAAVADARRQQAGARASIKALTAQAQAEAAAQYAYPPPTGQAAGGALQSGPVSGQPLDTGGGVITAGQAAFSNRLAAVTGLDVNLIKAWALAEMSDSYARGREAKGNHNWLNIGYFDSLGGQGAFQSKYGVWGDPSSAADATAAFLYGKFLGASSGIQRIVSHAGQPVEDQIQAIATSGWASSGYGGGSSLRGTYKLVPKTAQPARIQIQWRNPKTGALITLGSGGIF